MGSPQICGVGGQLKIELTSTDQSKKGLTKHIFFLNKRIFLHEIEGVRCIGQEKETF